MRQFSETYANTTIGQAVIAQTKSNSSVIDQPLTKVIGQSATVQWEYALVFNVSFTHHILLINKCKDLGETLFYMKIAAQLLYHFHRSAK